MPVRHRVASEKAKEQTWPASRFRDSQERETGLSQCAANIPLAKEKKRETRLL